MKDFDTFILTGALASFILILVLKKRNKITNELNNSWSDLKEAIHNIPVDEVPDNPAVSDQLDSYLERMKKAINDL